MESIIQFFNNTLPCPSEIPNCDALRLEYYEALNQLKRSGGCSQCAENRMKNEFIIKLQALMSAKP